MCRVPVMWPTQTSWTVATVVLISPSVKLMAAAGNLYRPGKQKQRQL